MRVVGFCWECGVKFGPRAKRCWLLIDGHVRVLHAYCSTEIVRTEPGRL